MTLDITKIHDRAMLTYLRIGCWSARKLDSKATKKVTDDSEATSDAARVNKNLLAAADVELRAIQKLGGEARRYLDTQTLPWDDAGNRLLPNEKLIEVASELTRYEAKFKELISDFVAKYPDLRNQALANLGAMANVEDYPPAEHVAAKFSFRLSFSPVPQGFNDVRTGLADEQVNLLQKHFEANARRQVEDALQAAWERLRENLGHYADRLREKDDGSGDMQVFRNSMVENLRETCAMLKTMNVFDNEALERMRLRVEREVASFNAQDLRESKLLATSVRSEVDILLAQMKDVLGE